MSVLASDPWFEPTSAAGSMTTPIERPFVLMGLMVAGLGLSGTTAFAVDHADRSLLTVERTTAGASIAAEADTDRADDHPTAENRSGDDPRGNGQTIAELRGLSGLTWDQLARLFDVSRRSLHFWASGKAMSAGNREHLQRLLATLRTVDRGTVDANRVALLDPREDGEIPFDRLVEKEYDRVVASLGPGDARRVKTPGVSAKAMAERAPPPPETLVGALHDRIHPTSGRLIGSKPISVRRDG